MHDHSLPNRPLRSRLVLLILPALALCLTACASGPSHEDVAQRIPPIPSNQGRVFFYRPSAMSGGLKPAIVVNGTSVGKAVSKGFLFINRPPGQYTVSTSTLLEHNLTFSLAAGEVKYVVLRSSPGLIAGHVFPTLANGGTAQESLKSMKYTGDPKLLQ